MDTAFLKEFSHSNRHNLAILCCSGGALPKAVEDLQRQGINVVNVGRVMAERFRGGGPSRFLELEAQEFFLRTLEVEAKILDQERPEVVAVFNVGVLFEPFFQLNAEIILKEMSKRIAIILLWEHLVDSPALLHWGVNSDKYRFDFSDINQAKVIRYEV